jgi:WD40 repeat protein
VGILGILLLIGLFIGLSTLLASWQGIRNSPSRSAMAAPATATPAVSQPPYNPQASTQFVQSLKPEAPWVTSLVAGASIAWSADGTSLAAVSPGSITVRNFATDTTSHVTLDFASPDVPMIAGVSWSHDGRFLAIGYGLGTTPGAGGGHVELWDPNNLSLIKVLTPAGGVVSMVWTWPPYAPVLAYSDGGRVKYWDEHNTPRPDIACACAESTPTPDPSDQAGPGADPNAISNVAWSPDTARLILATSQDNIIRLWDTQSGTALATLRNPGRVLSLVWSPDGTQLAVAFVGRDKDNDMLMLWDVGNATAGGGSQAPSPSQPDATMLGGKIGKLAWARNNILAVAIGHDNSNRERVVLYDPASRQVLRELKGLATDLAWSPDNQTLAVANATSGTVTLYGTGRPATPPAAPTVPPTGIADPGGTPAPTPALPTVAPTEAPPIPTWTPAPAISPLLPSTTLATPTGQVVEWEGLSISVPPHHYWQALTPQPAGRNGFAVLGAGRIAFERSQGPANASDWPEGIGFEIVGFRGAADAWLDLTRKAAAAQNPVDPGTIVERTVAGRRATGYSHAVTGGSRGENYIVKLDSDTLLLITVSDADNPDYQQVLSKLD